MIVRHINSFSPQPLPAKVWAYSWECLIESRDQEKKKTRPVFVGGIQVGGDAPVVVQSMTCTDTRDVQATVEQIRTMEAAGCEIVRVAVPDMEAAAALADIRKQIRIPLIADIHFNHRLALQAMKNGVDGIRINPGNMGVEKVKNRHQGGKVSECGHRIGINAGSLEKELLTKVWRAHAGCLGGKRAEKHCPL